MRYFIIAGMTAIGAILMGANVARFTGQDIYGVIFGFSSGGVIGAIAAMILLKWIQPARRRTAAVHRRGNVPSASIPRPRPLHKPKPFDERLRGYVRTYRGEAVPPRLEKENLPGPSRMSFWSRASSFSRTSPRDASSFRGILLRIHQMVIATRLRRRRLFRCRRFL